MLSIKSEKLIYDYKYYETENKIGSLRAVDGVDLMIEEGSFVAILGHNGSGKSTIAKTLNALITPTEGELKIYGYDAKDKKNIWNIRSNVGMVFQNPDNQIVSAIVEDDVAFGLENLGVESNEIRKRVDDALQWTGLTNFKENDPSNLSGGQKQRVAIAGILAMKPKCIILDEPTAMLDPIGRRDIINAVLKLNKDENITIVLITHFMEEAVLADKVYVMEDGKIIMEDNPRNIFKQVDKMKNIGLDVPEVTELAYILNKNGLSIKPDVLTIDEMVGELCQLR
ncbi:MAG: energy-coupling factor transporter ATPase [Lachnospirales bacterium]